MRSLLLISSLASLAGCTGNFDPALFRALPDGSAGEDGGQLDGGQLDGGQLDGGQLDGGPPAFVLGEYCTVPASVPRIDRPTPSDRTERISVSYAIDTRALADDVSAVAACTGSVDRGNDGFLVVHMNATERWHFHVRRPTDGMNPAIYILESDCDERTCAGTSGLDLCGAAADEHFSFVAPSTADYFVGIDATSVGGFTAQLDVIHPVCGNAMREHSEGCDDGGLVSGDGCDANCRVELASGGEEVEANDDIYAANHIPTSALTTVVGHIASACESDVYAFDAPADASMRLDVAGHLELVDGTCPVDATTPIEVALVGANGSTVIDSAIVPAGGGCLDVDGLTVPAAAATTYFIRVRSVNPDFARPVDYRIELTFASVAS